MSFATPLTKIIKNILAFNLDIAKVGSYHKKKVVTCHVFMVNVRRQSMAWQQEQLQQQLGTFVPALARLKKYLELGVCHPVLRDVV